jgi:hypothetical protein
MALILVMAFQWMKGLECRCHLHPTHSPKGGHAMRFCIQQHQFYCGIDLHARNMYVCIIDQKGKAKLHKNIPTGAEMLGM